MTIEECIKAAQLDFRRDYEPNEKEMEAFKAGLSYGMSIVLNRMIDTCLKGDKND